MKILALERDKPDATDADFEPHLKAEAAKVWELYKTDVIRELYFDAKQHTAVLVLEAHDVAEARLRLEDLPLVRTGLIRFDLIPLIPYPGFARLFADRVEG